MSVFSRICPFSFRQLSLLLILTIPLAVACGDESGITGADDGELEVNPNPINFSDTEIGETETLTVDFVNASDDDTTIVLSNLALESDPSQQGDHEVFELVDPWDGQLELGTDNDAANPETLDIEYTPEASENYNALLTFDTNLANRGDVTVEISAPTPEPEMVAADNLALERVPMGSTQAQTTEIENIGHADLELDDLFIADGSNHFWITFPQRVEEIDEDELSGDEQDAYEQIPDDAEYAGPLFDRDDEYDETIAPGESMLIRVYFEAPDDNFRSGTLQIDSNAPNAQPHHLMALTANSEAACLEIVEGAVDFGLASLNNASQQTVTLNNCSSNTETIVTDLELGVYDEDEDEFDPDVDLPFEIDEDSLPDGLQAGNNSALSPDESISLLAMYTPTAEETHEATLRIESTDEASPLYVDVLGEGVDRECPIAVAEASTEDTGVWSDEEVIGIPLDLIEFDGTDSYTPEDPDEDVSYEWYIAESPSNSTATVDDANTANPTLTTDIAGHFVVELMVYDELGIAACEPASIDVLIEPESAIHVELTWEVPASDDGTGVDLDLHYLHPAGNWSESPYGVYYNNDDPDWGDGSEISLDIDDLTGAEPENINHDNPDPAYDYSVGVYYFGDPFNYGATDARVRVYLHNALVYEEERRLEHAGQDTPGVGDFWHVGDVEIDGGAISFSEIDQFYEDSGFPN